MSKSISNSDDIIDSRDVIERIAELTDERDDLQGAVDEAETAYNTREECGDGEADSDKEIYLEEIRTAKAALVAWAAA